jgi:hypothetical protein
MYIQQCNSKIKLSCKRQNEKLKILNFLTSENHKTLTAFTIFKKNQLIVCWFDQNKNVTDKNVSEKTMDLIKWFIFQLFILRWQGKIFKIYQ